MTRRRGRGLDAGKPHSGYRCSLRRRLAWSEMELSRCRHPVWRPPSLGDTDVAHASRRRAGRESPPHAPSSLLKPRSATSSERTPLTTHLARQPRSTARLASKHKLRARSTGQIDARAAHAAQKFPPWHRMADLSSARQEQTARATRLPAVKGAGRCRRPALGRRDTTGGRTRLATWPPRIAPSSRTSAK